VYVIAYADVNVDVATEGSIRSNMNVPVPESVHVPVTFPGDA